MLYLAMGYVEGSDLRELLRREGRLEPERAVALVAQVADALDAAHAAGLVHRDVKPGNILVADEPDGEHAYVCDFGLARHVSSVEQPDRRPRLRRHDRLRPARADRGRRRSTAAPTSTRSAASSSSASQVRGRSSARASSPSSSPT